MKYISLVFLIIFTMLISTGCNDISLFGDEVNFEEVYNINGIVLDKSDENSINVMTSVLTGQVKVNPALWQQLQPGDTVETVLTFENIISAKAPSDNRVVISYKGSVYEVEGNILDKFENDKGFAVKVAATNVADVFYIDEGIWERLDVGKRVNIFYDLRGVLGIVE